MTCNDRDCWHREGNEIRDQTLIDLVQLEDCIGCVEVEAVTEELSLRNGEQD
ncbi:hypothetical protein HanPSC8_Chr04g0173331 [Helianthus annuus]|nr:hypothetical protein HanPSC8_Chr04g0173331 [Helianthus annuus]